MMQFIPNEESLKALSFVKNPAWDLVMEVLNTHIQAEVALAISSDVTQEKRAHSCGRAESLVDLQNYLIAMRQEALDAQKPLDSV